jgi:hypothetical protein
MGDARAILDQSIAARDVLVSWMSPGRALLRHRERGDDPRRSTKKHNAVPHLRQTRAHFSVAREASSSFCRLGSVRALRPCPPAKTANVTRSGIVAGGIPFAFSKQTR